MNNKIIDVIAASGEDTTRYTPPAATPAAPSEEALQTLAAYVSNPPSGALPSEVADAVRIALAQPAPVAAPDLNLIIERLEKAKSPMLDADKQWNMALHLAIALIKAG